MALFQTVRDRDAWATIRGFVYQIELTIARWLLLASNEHLELERGEDIDVVQRAWADQNEETLRVLEQVKHRDRSITLRSGEALGAIASFVEHRANNPALQLRFLFITNAQPTRERTSLLPKGFTGIGGWERLRTRQVGDGGDKKQLVLAISNLLSTAERPGDFSEDTWKAFKQALGQGEAWLSTLIDEFEWSTGAVAFDDLEPRIIADLQSSGRAADEATAEYQFFRLFQHTVRTLSHAGIKRLTAPERDGLLKLPPPTAAERITFEQVRSTIADIQARLAGHDAALQAHSGRITALEATILQSAVGAVGSLVPGEPTPDLSVPIATLRLTERRGSVEILSAALAQHTWTALYGGPGAGKTELARLLSAKRPTPAPWVRLRDLAPEPARIRLRAAGRELGGDPFRGNRRDWYVAIASHLGAGALLVLDDLPRMTAGDELAEDLLHLVLAFDTVGAHLLTTSVHAPPAFLSDRLEARLLNAVECPAFLDAEVNELLIAYGAPVAWQADAVRTSLRLAAGGNAQLLVGALQSLRRDRWPAPDSDDGSLVRRFRIEHETLKRLSATVPDQEQLELLYRLTLAIGSFDFPDVQAVGEVAPEIAQLRRHVDELLGMWLQADTPDRFLVSPLVRNLGDTELPVERRRRVHERWASRITDRRTLGVLDILTALHHLRSAESFDRAAAVLCWALHETRVQSDRRSARLLVAPWSEEPLPSEMRPALRVYLRCLQVAVADTLGLRTERLEEELVDVASHLTDEDAWALLPAVIVASPIIAHRSFSQAMQLLLWAHERTPTARLPGGDERFAGEIVAALDSWVWQLAIEIRRASDISDWLDGVERLPPERRAGVASSSLYASGCMAVANRLWLTEAAKPREVQQWQPVLTAMQDLARRARSQGLALLSAWAVRAQIIVLAEYMNRHDDAIRIGGEALTEDAAQDPRIRFTLQDALGREHLRVRDFGRAKDALSEAVGLDITDYPLLQMQSMIALADAVGNNDRNAAVEIVARACDLARTSPSDIPESELTKAQAELAVAVWLARGVQAAFQPWQEAAERLFSCKDDSRSWKALCMIFGHVSGYLTTLAQEGSPPKAIDSGEEYAAPRPGIFFGFREQAARMYDDAKLPHLMAQLAMFASAVGDDASATKWSIRAVDLANKLDAVEVQSLLLPNLVNHLVHADEYEKALDGARAASVASLRGMQKLAGNVRRPKWIEDLVGQNPHETARRAEYHALVLALLPAVFRVGLVALEARPAASDLARRVALSCQEVAQSAADPDLWRSAAELFNAIFIEASSAREIHKRSTELGTRFGEGLRAIAYIGATLQPDMRLEDAVIAHWEVVRFINGRNDSAALNRLFVTPFLEAFWKRAIASQRFRFAGPSLVESGLREAGRVTAEQRPAEILQAAAAGLGRELRKD